MVFVLISSAGVGSVGLEMEDEESINNFLINDGSSNARNSLLELLASGYLEGRPEWDEARIMRREMWIKIPSLNIEYVLPPEDDPPREAPPSGKEQEQINKKKGSLKWSHRGTLRLIFHWREQRDRFENNTEKNEAIWEEVTEAMLAEGFQSINSAQCENRFKYLKRIYMATKDLNRKSTGQPEKSCPYYEEMDEIFNKSPQVSPPSLCSSRDSNNINSDPISTIPINTDPNTAIAPTPAIDSPPPAKKTRLESSLTKWAEEFQQRSDNRDRICFLGGIGILPTGPWRSKIGDILFSKSSTAAGIIRKWVRNLNRHVKYLLFSEP